MSKLGDNIKAARIRCSMTQEQLANVLNTSKAAISRYESGKRMPNIEQLSKIALATNTTVSELVEPGYWTNAPEYEKAAAFSSNPKKEILCGLFDQLNEMGQQRAMDDLADLVEIQKYRKPV